MNLVSFFKWLFFALSIHLSLFSAPVKKDLTKKGEDKNFELEIKNECNSTSLSVFIQPIKGGHRNPIVGINKDSTKILTLPSRTSKIIVSNFWVPSQDCLIRGIQEGTIKARLSSEGLKCHCNFVK